MTNKYPNTEAGDLVVIKPAPPCSTNLLTQARFLYRSLRMVVPLFSAMYVRFKPYRNGNLSAKLFGSKKKKKKKGLIMGKREMAKKMKLGFIFAKLQNFSGEKYKK